MTSGAARSLAFDTSAWIHWIEEHPGYLPELETLFAGVYEGRIVAVSSVLVLLEVLTGARLRGDDMLGRRYESIFSDTRNVILLDVSPAIARDAARLRAVYRVATPDAIHLATAIGAEAAAFVTTDRRLARVKEIPIRVLKPAAPRRRRR